MPKRTGQKITLQLIKRRHIFITRNGCEPSVEFLLELSRQGSAPRPSNKKKTKSVVEEPLEEEETKMKPSPKTFFSGT